MSGLGGSQPALQDGKNQVPIHEYARDNKGRYDKEILLKLLSKTSGNTDEEIDFIFEYLMVGDQFGGWAQHDANDSLDGEESQNTPATDTEQLNDTDQKVKK